MHIICTESNNKTDLCLNHALERDVKDRIRQRKLLISRKAAHFSNENICKFLKILVFQYTFSLFRQYQPKLKRKFCGFFKSFRNTCTYAQSNMQAIGTAVQDDSKNERISTNALPIFRNDSCMHPLVCSWCLIYLF